MMTTRVFFKLLVALTPWFVWFLCRQKDFLFRHAFQSTISYDQLWSATRRIDITLKKFMDKYPDHPYLEDPSLGFTRQMRMENDPITWGPGRSGLCRVVDGEQLPKSTRTEDLWFRSTNLLSPLAQRGLSLRTARNWKLVEVNRKQLQNHQLGSFCVSRMHLRGTRNPFFMVSSLSASNLQSAGVATCWLLTHGASWVTVCSVAV